MAVEIVRKAEDAPTVSWWDMSDGVYSIHVAELMDGTTELFRSRNDVWPSLTAFKLNLDYKLLRNATREECKQYLGNTPAKEIIV